MHLLVQRRAENTMGAGSSSTVPAAGVPPVALPPPPPPPPPPSSSSVASTPSTSPTAAVIRTPAERVVNRGVELLAEAVAADKARNYQQAFEKYQAALDVIFPVINGTAASSPASPLPPASPDYF